MSSPSKRSRIRLLIAFAVVVTAGGALLAFIAGYNGALDPNPPAAHAPSSADPGVRYDTAAAVMDAMRAKGLQCDGYKTIPIEQYDERALQSAFCKTADGTELNVSVYANSEDARSSVQRHYDKRAQRYYGAVGAVGGNWAVHVTYSKRGWIPDVSRALNGSIIEIPPVK